MLDLVRIDEFPALRSAVRAVAADHISAAATPPNHSATIPPTALAALGGTGLLSPRSVEDGGVGIPDHLDWAAIAEIQRRSVSRELFRARLATD